MKYGFWAIQVVSGVLDTEGRFFPLDSLEQTFNRDANGRLTTVVASDGTSSWTQTYDYKNETVSHISPWVRTGSPIEPTKPPEPPVQVSPSMRFNAAINSQYVGIL